MIESNEISSEPGVRIIDCVGDDQRRYIAAVLARHGLRDEGVIDDITQETFLRLIAADGSLNFPTTHHLSAWLARTALNHLRDTQRDYGREQARFGESYELWMRPRDQFEIFEAQDELSTLFQAAGISSEDQRLLLMMIGERRSNEEVLNITGLPRTTLFNRRRAGLKALKHAAKTIDNPLPEG